MAEQNIKVGDKVRINGAKEPKMFTTTTINTREEWINQDRVVSITSGRGGLTLNVKPNPASIFESSGRTGLTVEQAEQLANDLLERVAEIRAGLKEEAGA